MRHYDEVARNEDWQGCRKHVYIYIHFSFLTSPIVLNPCSACRELLWLSVYFIYVYNTPKSIRRGHFPLNLYRLVLKYFEYFLYFKEKRLIVKMITYCDVLFLLHYRTVHTQSSVYGKLSDLVRSLIECIYVN